MSEARQVQMPSAYFRKSKSEYRDWRWAMVREFIQNSYDAQAANIAFELKVVADDHVEMRVSDDGIGMDQDTLENVLLCMGGSKKLPGSVGGFGWAKSLLFFAHHNYTIHTHDLLVQGSGGNYTISTADYREGTCIVVALDDGNYGLPDWQQVIARYVAQCWMATATGRGVTIILDGQELAQQNEVDYEVLIDTGAGSVWYNEKKGEKCSEIMVSVGGLPMFVENVYSDTSQLAIIGGMELADGSGALTANRDGFNSKFRDTFAKVTGYLVQNQSALRYGNALDLSINFGNGVHSPNGVLPENGDGTATTILVRKDGDSADLSKYAAVLARIARENFPANFHLKLESISARRSAKTEAYITAPALVAEMNKHRSAKLARSWRAALSTILNCDWALANGVEFYDGPNQITDWAAFDGDTLDLHVFFRGRRVDPGFCFIAKTAGLCSSVAEGDKPHRIFINPLLLTGETAFRAGDTLDLAYHEAAHLWEQHHGEAFCGVEAKLRQSVRRWLSEKEVIARMAYAQAL